MGVDKTWTAPEPGTTYICYGEDGTPDTVGTYADFLDEIDEKFWPHSQEDYETLLWAYNAEATRE